MSTMGFLTDIQRDAGTLVSFVTGVVSLVIWIVTLTSWIVGRYRAQQWSSSPRLPSQVRLESLEPEARSLWFTNIAYHRALRHIGRVALFLVLSQVVVFPVLWSASQDSWKGFGWLSFLVLALLSAIGARSLSMLWQLVDDQRWFAKLTATAVLVGINLSVASVLFSSGRAGTVAGAELLALALPALVLLAYAFYRIVWRSLKLCFIDDEFGNPLDWD